MMSGTGEGGGVRESLENAVVDTLDPVVETKPEVINAPETWADEDKNNFNKITDAETRKWLLSRDEGYTKKLGDYESRYADFDKIFAPHQERLKAVGQSPSSVINNLLNAQVALETKPLESLLYLAQVYGVDLATHFGGKAPEKKEGESDDPFADLDPNLSKWMKGVQSTLGQITNRFSEADKMSKEQAAAQLNNTMTEFRQAKDDKGAVLYPHLSNEKVAKRMATLISTGEVAIVNGDVKSALKEAYDQAIGSFPDTRPKPEVGLSESQRLLKAKRAGASVTGVGASSSAQQQKGSVRDLLKAGFQERNLL